MAEAKTYLGLDLSTQQIKAAVTNDNLSVIHVANVTFETDLPEFRTEGGVHHHNDGVTITSPTLMWVKALDLLFEKLKHDNVQFGTIAAISGAGQQHGSVYWKHGAKKILNTLNASSTLHEQLKGCFSKANSPIWMDTSTTEQCVQLEEAVGSSLTLAQLTGSRGFHRFTGPQIAKIYQKEPNIYEETERISLVSSFACSLFLGEYAPIDWSDGSGMNLMDIETHDWNKQCLDTCAPDLRTKLGPLVPSETDLGPISSYFVDRYGFPSNCRVVTFTGDNPSSLAGINQVRGDVAVSWGTSDTVFVWLDHPKAALDMHVLANPVDKNAYMGMLCFKNGAFTRERIRLSCNCDNWDDFNKLLKETPPGNNGNIGFYYDYPEILPNLSNADHRFNGSDEKVQTFPINVEARAVIEHQCLTKRVHAETLGYSKGGRVLVTGGASVNISIMHILANVFDGNVYIQNVANSAAVGGAYRAKHALVGGDFSEVCKDAAQFKLAATPETSAVKVYNEMAQRYEKLECTLK